jgi:3-oxoacyl-[acyl-carrier-protein] synthase I
MATSTMWLTPRLTNLSPPDVAGEPIYVVSLGASTPIGRTAWSSAAAVRAGISGFTEHPHAIDSEGEPLRVASAPWLEFELEGTERLEALLFPAIDDALQPLVQSPADRVGVALALGLPPPRPGVPEDLDRQLRLAIDERYPNRFAAIATFPVGHAGGLQAVDAAARKLEEGTFDACVIAGVDSYLALETLEWLEDTDRVHGAGPLNNAWGFVPGEGAGAVLMATTRARQQIGLEPLALFRGVGLGTEPNVINSPTVCVGVGLTAAFRSALSLVPHGVRVTDVYCDLNGEPYRADEYGFTCLRTKQWFASASDFVAPADCWGDVAAASGPLCMALAAIAGRKGYASGSLAFVSASSESGERAGVLLETVPPTR